MIKTCGECFPDDVGCNCCCICEGNVCSNCYWHETMNECESCHGHCCDDCCKFGNDFAVCKECYDDSIIKCNKCGMECILLYKENPILVSNDDKKYKDKSMEICNEKDCFNYICLNCNDHEDDKYYYCDMHDKC